jgi:hypothetical protein
MATMESMIDQLPPPPPQPRKRPGKLVIAICLIAVVLVASSTFLSIAHIRSTNQKPESEWNIVLYAGQKTETTWSSPTITITGEQWRIEVDEFQCDCQITVYSFTNNSTTTFPIQPQTGFLTYELTSMGNFVVTVNVKDHSPSLYYWYLTIDQDYTSALS